MIRDGLERQFLARDDVARLRLELERAVAAGTMTQTEAARRLLGALDEGANKSLRAYAETDGVHRLRAIATRAGDRGGGLFAYARQAG